MKSMNFPSYNTYNNFDSNLRADSNTELTLCSIVEESQDTETYCNYFGNENLLSTTILKTSCDKSSSLLQESILKKNLFGKELQTFVGGRQTDEQPLFYNFLNEQQIASITLNDNLFSESQPQQQEQEQKTQAQENFGLDELLIQSNEELNKNNFEIQNLMGQSSDLVIEPIKLDDLTCEPKQFSLFSLESSEPFQLERSLNGGVSWLNSTNNKFGFPFLNKSTNHNSVLISQPQFIEKIDFTKNLSASTNTNNNRRKRSHEEGGEEEKEENCEMRVKVEKSHKTNKKRRKNKQKEDNKQTKNLKACTNKNNKKNKCTSHKSVSTETKRRSKKTSSPKKSIKKTKKKKKIGKNQNKGSDDFFIINSVVIPTEKGKRVKIFKRRKPTRSGRLKTTNYAKKLFENWFNKHLDQHEGPYPDKKTRKMMSEKTGIPELQVTRWFGQRRRSQRILWEKNKAPKPKWVN
ncbi:hypothetical protein M0812_29383 [Anaeramoeba flamelloides]|uniref:Homeobox domain-containing protein n=1 Tax=Anaeramoeba flamelloides TaxID=1746091 RepID=A0AAV7Y935_9EUKA|nr:hypothetical protein M0812_29383 [Anaeramoeba flamelloides]